jgi:hypothetical protein
MMGFGDWPCQQVDDIKQYRSSSRATERLSAARNSHDVPIDSGVVSRNDDLRR